MLLLIICLFFALITFKSKKDNKILERCKDGKNFYETVEESLYREKVTKTFRYIVCYTFLGIFALFMLLPFYWMIITSLKTEAEISLTKPTFFPKEFAWENYKYVFSAAYQKKVSGGSVRFDLWRYMYNTLIVGVFSTIGTLVTTVMAAFAFSRIKFPGRELIFTIFLATMMIPGEMMVITNFITVSKLKGMNTYWAMIVPFLISVYYIYLLRQNFRQIPNELYYAAKVDGTSNFKYLMKIMIPIAMPTLITITILKLMGSWNAYVWPMMVTNKPEMRLITTGLRTGFSDSEGRSVQGRQMAAAFAVTAPLLIMFICLRKYIMRGVSRSGIKG
jgi:ABC transporter, permease protein